MGDPLRDWQSLGALAANRQVIEFDDKIGDFERLAGSVESDLAMLEPGEVPPDWRKSPVRGRLSFAPAATGNALVSGRLEARVPAVCQRCLAPFEWPLASPVELRFRVDGAATGTGDDDRELWELPGDRIRPIDIVDELLVMALPLSARHDDTGSCRVAAAEPADTDMTTPFAGLRAQMDKARKE